jgi:hypothetical protein
MAPEPFDNGKGANFFSFGHDKLRSCYIGIVLLNFTDKRHPFDIRDCAALDVHVLPIRKHSFRLSERSNTGSVFANNHTNLGPTIPAPLTSMCFFMDG